MNKLVFHRGLMGVGLLLALSFALLGIRYMRLGYPLYIFMSWNLFLAALPILFAWSAGKAQQPLPRLFWLGSWLLFFPNSAYVITDLMHLPNLASSFIWFDATLFFVCALAGLVMGLFSLRLIHQTLHRWQGSGMAWAGIISSIGLSGYGIYLGRFVRLNSWDIFTHPLGLARTCLTHATTPLAIKTTLVFSLVTAVLYLAYCSMLPQPDPQSAD